MANDIDDWKDLCEAEKIWRRQKSEYDRAFWKKEFTKQLKAFTKKYISR